MLRSRALNRLEAMLPERDPKTGRFPPRPAAPKGGEGWGGAAKGMTQAAGITPEVRALRWDKDNAAQKEEIAAEMRAVLYNVALNGDADAARINAADKLLDRIEGKAVQKSQISGADGGVLVIDRRIVDPKAPE